MAFEPSQYSSEYGAEAASTVEGETAPAKTGFFDKLVSTVSGALTGQDAQIAGWQAAIAAIQDPRLRVAALEAKIKNYRHMKSVLPGSVEPFRTMYQNEIVKMKSKLAAEKINLELEKEGESSTKRWRFLGQTGVVAGIGIGIAVIYYVVKKANKA